jgi:gamma-glutamylaminecyclotransferase
MERKGRRRGVRTPADRTLVFVYGTLLGGESNHRHLVRARLIAPAATEPAFQLHDLGAFPALIRGGTQAVAGEVYDVDEPTLAALDFLEGHPKFYRRTSIVLSHGAAVEAYLMSPEQVGGHPIITSGSWRGRQKDSRP